MPLIFISWLPWNGNGLAVARSTIKKWYKNRWKTWENKGKTQETVRFSVISHVQMETWVKQMVIQSPLYFFRKQLFVFILLMNQPERNRHTRCGVLHGRCRPLLQFFFRGVFTTGFAEEDFIIKDKPCLMLLEHDFLMAFHTGFLYQGFTPKSTSTRIDIICVFIKKTPPSKKEEGEGMGCDVKWVKWLADMPARGGMLA